MNVPDELRKTAAEALSRWQETRAVVCEHSQIIDYGDAAETVLAAVLERHEVMVLQRASEKLMARAEEYAGARTGSRATWRRALQASARHILPTPTPQQVADAIADGTAFVVGCPSLDEEIARGDADAQ